MICIRPGYPIGYSGYRQYVTYLTPRYSERSIGGWTSTLSPPIIEEKIDIYDEHGKPVGSEFDEVFFLPSLYSSLTRNYQSIFSDSLSDPDRPCGWNCSHSTSVCVDGNCEWGCVAWDYNSYCADQCRPGDACYPTGEPRPSYYIKRVHVRTSDGSTHEFRKSDSITPYCYSAGHPNNGPGCDPAGMDRLGVYLAVDNSGMKLDRTSSGSILSLPNGDVYKFPSESQHIGNEVRLFFATEFQDVNGNTNTFTETQDEYNRYFLKKTDSMERQFTDPLPSNFGIITNLDVKQQDFSLPGIGNAAQNYKLIWKRLKPRGCEAEVNTPGCGSSDGALQNQNEKLFYDAQTQCLGASLTAIPGTAEFLFPMHGWGLRSCSSYMFEEDSNGNVTAAPNRFNPTVLWPA